jgi:hypothetical protein
MASDFVYSTKDIEKALEDATGACQWHKENGENDNAVCASLNDLGVDGNGLVVWIHEMMEGMPPEAMAIFLAGIHIGIQTVTNKQTEAVEFGDQFNG